MEISWVPEPNPVWDTDCKRVIGGAPDGAFVLPFKDGQDLPGDWWSARDGDGAVLGYGRLDTTWGGDAEILLAVDPGAQQRGIGSFILGKLEQEALDRGINYVYNTIGDHDQRDLVHDWLVVRGFSGSNDSELRKRVRGTAPEPERPEPRPAERYDASADPGGRAPGHEESGGYVNIEEHRY